MSGLQDRVQDTKERFQDWMADRKDAKGGSGRLIVWLVVLYLLVALVVARRGIGDRFIPGRAIAQPMLLGAAFIIAALAVTLLGVLTR